MQHLEVSCAVRPIKWPLGVKWLMYGWIDSGVGGKKRSKSMIFPVLLLDTKIWYRTRFLKFGNVIHSP